MNKGSLATILGTALLGLAKSKGSSARRSVFDEIFKRRVGNQNQTYRVFFEARYQPFWEEGYQYYNLKSSITDYIETYKETIIDMLDEFDSYVENEWILSENGTYYSADQAGMLEQQIHDFDPAEYSLEEIFKDYCDTYNVTLYYDEDYPYNHDDLKGWRNEKKDVERFSVIEVTSSSSDYSDTDVIDQTISLARQDSESGIEKVFDPSFQDENPWASEFVDKLRREGNYFFRNAGISWNPNNYTEFDQVKPRLLEHTDILKNYLQNISNQLFEAQVDFINWDDHVEPDAGFIEGYVDIRLDLHSMNWDEDHMKSILSGMLEYGYKEWLRDNRQDENESFQLDIIKVEPDIFAKNKSNLRKR